jgi:hypothetical protein
MSALTFLFTLFYFLRPGKTVKSILLIFFLINPAILYMSNYISADSLFIGLSFLWLSSLLWVIYQPKPWPLISQAILLLACFTVRYNAIYYPFIAAIAFLISRYRWYWKVTGIALGSLLVLSSILYTTLKMKELTGTKEFSAFGGWQLANNALYMYETIPAKERGNVPERFAKLETMVRQHIDTLSKVKLTAEDTVSARFYLWSPKGPLVQYMAREYKKDSTTPAFKRWAAQGPLFGAYGAYLIRKYPLPFVKAWLWPNTERYAIPPAEFLKIYNMGGDSVGPLAKIWFNYKSQRVDKNNKITAIIRIMSWYPPFAVMANVFFLICLVGMLIFKGFKSPVSTLTKFAMLFISLWLCNTGFSIFASPITLRYQLFPLIVNLSLGVILMQNIYQLAKQEEIKLKFKTT